MRALQEVTKSQSLRYNFPFSEFMFPTDITVVVATDAKKSVFLEVFYISLSYYIKPNGITH